MKIIIKSFEELSTRELYEILKVRNEVFFLEQRCMLQDCDDGDFKSYHLMYEEDGILGAYLRIPTKGVSYDETSIGRVLVRMPFRGRGLGRKCMMEAINFVEGTLKEDIIKISAQEYLLDFYKSLGFNEASEVYYEDHIPHVKMIYIKK